MKSLLYWLFLLLPVFTQAQSEKDYTFNTPSDWRTEKVVLPPEFAPDFPLKGNAEVRFSPGWPNQEDEEFWTYTILWIVEQEEEPTGKELNEAWISYFDGLMSKVGAKVWSDSLKTIGFLNEESNKTNYQGEYTVYDAFFRKDKITLKIKTEISYCEKQKKWAVLNVLSHQEMDHSVWDKLALIFEGFSCDN